MWNVPYGELGGMGLIRKGVNQGAQAMAASIRKNKSKGNQLDVVIVDCRNHRSYLHQLDSERTWTSKCNESNRRTDSAGRFIIFLKENIAGPPR